eukprot:Em0005g1488a
MAADGNELLLLATYIEENNNWLRSTLQRLGWTKKGLENRKDSPHLVQCTQNPRHLVPQSSADSHALRCQYASKGIRLDSDTEEQILSDDHFYRGTFVRSVKTTPAVENAVLQYVSSQTQMASPANEPKWNDHEVRNQREFIHRSEVVVESLESQSFSSLEDSQPSPPEVFSDPLHTIRFIKSWKLVPLGLHPSKCVPTVSWGPSEAGCSRTYQKSIATGSSLGGEVQAVETIVHFLSPPSQEGDISLATTPNKLMEALVPLFGTGTRSFVLLLWKHIHISRAQAQHNIPDTVVDDLLPLLMARPKDGLPSVLESIQTLIDKNPTWPHTPSTSLPTEYVFYSMSPAQRLAMYEYVVAVTGRQTAGIDPDLVRDDNVSKLGKDGEGDGRKSYLELLQEQRDYKRRRQSYRAKNVHITKRTPLQFTHHWNLTSNACHVTSPKVVPKSTGCVAESTIGLAQGAERGGVAHKGTLEVVRGGVAHKGLAQEAEKKGCLVRCRDIVMTHSHSCRNPQEDKPLSGLECPRPEEGCPRPEQGCPRLEQGCPRPEQGFPRLGPGGHAQEAVMDGTDHLGLIRKSDTTTTTTVTVTRLAHLW